MSVKAWISRAAERLRDALDGLRPRPQLVPVPVPVRSPGDPRRR